MDAKNDERSQLQSQEVEEVDKVTPGLPQFS